MEPETKADLAIRMARRLPAEEFAVLNLDFGIDGDAYKTREIARILEISSIQVRNRFDRAVHLLELAIGIDEGDISLEDLTALVIAGRMREERDPKAKDDGN